MYTTVLHKNIIVRVSSNKERWDENLDASISLFMTTNQ